MWCRCDIIVDYKFRCPCWRCTMDGWMDRLGLEAAYKQPTGQLASCMPELPLWLLSLPLLLSLRWSRMFLTRSLSLSHCLSLCCCCCCSNTRPHRAQHTLPTVEGCWTEEWREGGMDERPENQQVPNLQHEPENECRKKYHALSKLVCFPFSNFSVSVFVSSFF